VPAQRSEAALRVTLVAACPFPSAHGTSARAFAQARALRRLGLGVQVVTYHLGERAAPADLDVVRIPDVPTYRKLSAGPSPQKLALLDPLLFAQTLRAARSYRSHLLHGHHAEGGLVALAAGRILGLPVVFDAHTSVRAELPTYRLALPAAFLARVGAHLDRFLVRHADRVIAVTESLRTELLGSVPGAHPPGHVCVVPTGFEPQELALDAEEVEPGSDTLRPTLVYAGSLAPFQRLDLLREAFDRVLTEAPDAELHILSSDPIGELEAVWPGASTHPSVRLEHTSDLTGMFEALAGAHVAVSPRTSPGGLPQKLLNYVRVGLPVVASRGSGELLRDGETGLVVPDDDPRAFADASVALLQSPALRRRLGGAARKEARERFGWEGVAAAIVSVYRAALDEARDRARPRPTG
jgi:glycosyltransferase involved in cell wall biosynthesis